MMFKKFMLIISNLLPVIARNDPPAGGLRRTINELYADGDLTAAVWLPHSFYSFASIAKSLLRTRLQAARLAMTGR
jgi:hypothetical protein